MMVIYLPVKIEFRQTDKKRTNERRNYTNLKRNLAMMVMYLPVNLNSIRQSVFELESGNRMLTDRQMDKKTDKSMDRITPISKET